jgi:RHS repeat-associated protein
MRIFRALVFAVTFFATYASQAKYCDDETDLVYYGYRYYNPTGGRWLSRDPIGEDGGMNLYCMTANNPINHFDQFGLMTLQQVDAQIKELDDEFNEAAIPCCCSKNLQTIQASLKSASISGSTVSVAVNLNIKPTSAQCSILVLDYYWWNCFRAHNDAVAAGVPITGVNDEAWKNYGWQDGGQTDTETATGSSSVIDQFDAHHWNWMALVVYQMCNHGILRVYSVPAGQLQYTWSSFWPYGWTSPGPP